MENTDMWWVNIFNHLWALLQNLVLGTSQDRFHICDYVNSTLKKKKSEIAY